MMKQFLFLCLFISSINSLAIGKDCIIKNDAFYCLDTKTDCIVHDSQVYCPRDLKEMIISCPKGDCDESEDNAFSKIKNFYNDDNRIRGKVITPKGSNATTPNLFPGSTSTKSK